MGIENVSNTAIGGNRGVPGRKKRPYGTASSIEYSLFEIHLRISAVTPGIKVVGLAVDLKRLILGVPPC